MPLEQKLMLRSFQLGWFPYLLSYTN